LKEVPDRFEKALRLVDLEAADLTDIEINEYFEYADLALSLRSKVAGKLKRAVIQYLVSGDLSDNSRYGTIAKLVSLNLDRFSEEDIRRIVAICRSKLRQATEPRPIHFLSDILHRLNESFDWNELK
jgi:hypothetical protein